MTATAWSPYSRSGTIWTAQAVLDDLETEVGLPDLFGGAVDVELRAGFGQDVVVDGITILVSSYDYEVGPSYGAGGAVYVFRRSGAT